MSRSALKFFAVLLSVLIIVVLFAGLDDLPRAVRAQIGEERAALSTAQAQIEAARQEVARALKAEPALFAAVAASRLWPAELDKAAATIQAAARDGEALARFEKQNRRTERQQVESLLAHERGMRTAALAAAASVRKDVGYWLDLKRNLPQALQRMEKDYASVHSLDLDSLASTVDKAGKDWPEKKPDLDSRLAALRASVSEGEKAWESSAAARRDAAAGSGASIALVASAAESLKTAASTLPARSGELKSLTAQLYDSWDKVLVDMEVRGIGTAREYNQKIRTVRVHLADSTAKTGQTTSEEKWVDVTRAGYDSAKNNLGMAIEHKAAGKYDSESERTAQPAGFAYMATPAQGSNQYGYWEHRDGRDFWVFYGQYALLRDLLFNRNYRPLDRGDWEGYRTSRQRGQTYYGRDETASAPKYGSQGTSTQRSYSGSTYSRGGGFRDSEYATKGGSYRDSEYASPAARDRNSNSSPRTFGRSTRREEPHVASPPPRTYRPSPRPSFRPPMRSPGRTFGRRR